ncbi:hypothetical protein ACFW95_43790 [Streptomyces sp. NPDC059474]|uniref:hypothetical protein n=1 Tax=Streptomyces sp. NPDC059474 TaxID=3346846 RepID=UPI00368C97B2
MRRARERFGTGGTALVCLLSALTTGCSSGSGGDDSSSPLMAAVGHISVAGATGAQVSYLDAAGHWDGSFDADGITPPTG